MALSARSRFVLALFLLVSAAGIAQELTLEENLESAWRDYKLAVKSDNSESLVSTAERVHKLGEQYFEADDERFAIIAFNYGKALLAADRKSDAADILKLALERYEAIHGKDSMALIPVLEELADASADPANPAHQAKYYKRATGLAAAHHGETSKEYADALLRAGKHLYQGSRSVAGRKYLETANEIYSAELETDSLLAAESAYFLGKVHFSDRKYRSAEKSLLAALDGYPIDTPTGHQRQLLTRALLVQTYEYIGDSGRATEHCLAIGKMNMLDPDQKIQPLFRLAAQYPIDMLAKRREGHVDVGFVVDEAGFVRDPRILTRSGGASFEQAALEAVERFRYAPKFVNGQAVETPYVRTRVTFRIE